MHNLATKVIFLDWPLTNLVNEESNGCDEGRVRVLSRSCHLCQCGEKGDAVGAVDFTQPGLKPLLVLWVWKWTVAIMAAQDKKYNTDV